jgi:hypothetical protein
MIDKFLAYWFEGHILYGRGAFFFYGFVACALLR